MLNMLSDKKGKNHVENFFIYSDKSKCTVTGKGEQMNNFKKQAAERIQQLVKTNYEECNQYIRFNYCLGKNGSRAATSLLTVKK